jgi:hypothetical protein
MSKEIILNQENKLIATLESGIKLFERDAIEVDNGIVDGAVDNKPEKLILILTTLPILVWYDRKNENFYDFNSVFKRDLGNTLGKSIESRLTKTFQLADFNDNVKYLGNYKNLDLE